MAIDQVEFRHVMGHFATGVTVVTTCVADICHGITVSSFASLSLEPQLVLICISQQASFHAAVAEAGTFAVNILADDAEWLSRLFASADADRFAKTRYRLGQVGAPVLDDALAVIECRLHSQLPGGDHSVFVGEVMAAQVQRQAKPLLYFRSGYNQIA